MHHSDFQSIKNWRRIPGTNLFRSAGPDDVSQEELEDFTSSVKTIYDLRSWKGYQKVKGSKTTNSVYQPVTVSPSSRKGDLQFQTVDGHNCDTDFEKGRYHCFFNLGSDDFMKVMTKEAPLRYRIGLTVADFLCKIFRWSFLQRLVIQFILNSHGTLKILKCILQQSGPEICAVFRTMSKTSNLPGLVCCFHGKDRTGLISALLMGLAGVEKQAIVTDYFKSEDYLKKHRTSFWTNCRKKGLRSALLRSLYIMSVEKETMAAMLEYVEDKHGSIPNYLASIGFDTDEQKLLKSKITATEN